LIDDASRNVVALKGVGHRSLLALSPPDFGVRGEVNESARDQRFDAAAIDVGRLGALVLPLADHHPAKPAPLAAMWVGDENLADLAKVVARLNHARRHAAASVD